MSNTLLDLYFLCIKMSQCFESSSYVYIISAFVSHRNTKLGSPFIRAFIIALYKYGASHDMQQLFELVSEYASIIKYDEFEKDSKN